MKEHSTIFEYSAFDHYLYAVLQLPQYRLYGDVSICHNIDCMEMQQCHIIDSAQEYMYQCVTI